MNPEYWMAHFRYEPPPRGMPTAFGIVTACNPGGSIAPEFANEAADQALAARIDASGWQKFRVIGGSEDFSHAEPGWGVVASGGLAALLVLGREFHQVAIYWVAEDQIFLCDCSPGSSPVLIARWEDRARVRS
ncbi:MAG: DUF3293 domain-containing protein [Verrucomicrobiales bacterium]